MADAAVAVALVDRYNCHGFWSLLYQVATAGLGADDIARSLRALLARHPAQPCAPHLRVRRCRGVIDRARRADRRPGRQRAGLIDVTLASDFPRLDVSKARAVVVEAVDHLLSGFSARSQPTARTTLSGRNVEVWLDATKLATVEADRVVLEGGATIPTRTVVWTARLQANPLAETIPCPKGKGGTIPVTGRLLLPDRPEVFVIGDLAEAKGRGGKPLPQLSQPAIQGARHVAKTIRLGLEDKTNKPFRYHNHGIMATIGRGGRGRAARRAVLQRHHRVVGVADRALGAPGRLPQPGRGPAY